MKKNNQKLNILDIAVVGLSIKAPGANNAEEYWQNLRLSKDSISFFSNEELPKSTGSQQKLTSNSFVPAKGIINNADLFDAAMFRYTALEAQIMDPQMRLAHESAWELLESSGYNPQKTNCSVGVFLGAKNNTDWINLVINKKLINQTNPAQKLYHWQLINKNFLTTKLAYKFNFLGPAINIDTLCSTSLVTIHLACRSLLGGECDLAIAGGVSIGWPIKNGYFYQKNFILSPDGHTRSFDKKAQGTVFSDGLGLVLLKRLSDAIKDNDNVLAVIKGSAINNDGNLRAAYSAPSVNGQIQVIKNSLAFAQVNPETITYVEAHGTATPLGDTVEVEALTKAFNTKKRHYCAIGSVKSNIGHLDVAAGVAGFIKTVLALQHKQIPASINFTKPNPKIDFKHSPFFVNTKLRDWKRIEKDIPLRAGISSFGVGGTNAHITLEEAPELAPTDRGKDNQLIVLSAKTETALEKMRLNLIKHLIDNPNINLADVSYTLQSGRAEFNHRLAIVCSNNLNQAIISLKHKPQTSLIKRDATNVGFRNKATNRTQTIILTEKDRSKEKSTLDKLALLWLKGATIDWPDLHRKEKRRRLPLPTYPFERQRYWIDEQRGRKSILSPKKEPKIINPKTIIDKIWRKHFGYKKINSNATFFELGGSSLDIIKIASEINNLLGVNPKNKDFYRYPTVNQLSVYIKKLLQKKKNKTKTAIPAAKKQSNYRLSYTQQMIWTLYKLNPKSPFYNEPFINQLVGSLNIEALKKSFQQLVDRHEPLRTSFREIKGEPRQVIMEKTRINIKVVDLSKKGGVDKSTFSKKIIKKNGQKIFKLEKGPLVRPLLIKISPLKHILMLTHHHIISDIESHNLLAKELMILYQAQIEKKPNPLPRLKIQFKDYAEWEDSKQFRSKIKKQEKYWLKKFNGKNLHLTLPTDKPRPQQSLHKGNLLRIDLKTVFSEEIIKNCRKKNMTIFNFLLATYAVFLNKLSGTDQVSIGILINNRKEKELKNIFGIFFNSMPLLTKINPNNTFEEFLKNVRQEIANVIDNSEYPFSYLSEKIKPLSSPSRPFLFNVMFQENNFFTEERAEKVKLVSIPTSVDASKVDLKINVRKRKGRISIIAEYDTDLFSQKTIKRWLKYYLNLITQVLDNPETKIKNLSLLNKKEIKKMPKGY